MNENDHIMQIMGQIERRIDIHESKLETLNTVPATLQQIDRKLWESDQTLRVFSKKIDENTLITASIRDAQIAGKTINGVSKWIASLIVGASAVWAAIRGFK